MLKTYIAIGHFKWSKNLTCAALKTSSIKDFREQLFGNEFIPYCVISENKMNLIRNANSLDLMNIVDKLTSNWRVKGDLEDYIEQCLDIMNERFEAAKRM